MFKVLELSGLFVCLGGLVKIFSDWRTEEIAGFWFAGGGSVPRLGLWCPVSYLPWLACDIWPVAHFSVNMITSLASCCQEKIET